MKRKENRVISRICYAAAAVCLAYFVFLIFYTGQAWEFHLFWPLLALFLAAVGKLREERKRGRIHLPKLWLILFRTLCAAGVLILLCVEAVIVANGNAVPDQGAEYVIVLGTGVKGTEITPALRYRLNAAQSYLEENPRTRVIVSGGQSLGEDIPEAEAMADYLKEQGIDPERIIREGRSENTDENIRFSREIIGDDDAKTVVVTNAFHIYRSLGICKKQGMTNVQGLGARSNPVMVPTFYLREAFAVIKYKLAGQI